MADFNSQNGVTQNQVKKLTSQMANTTLQDKPIQTNAATQQPTDPGQAEQDAEIARRKQPYRARIARAAAALEEMSGIYCAFKPSIRGHEDIKKSYRVACDDAFLRSFWWEEVAAPKYLAESPSSWGVDLVFENAKRGLYDWSEENFVAEDLAEEMVRCDERKVEELKEAMMAHLEVQSRVQFDELKIDR
ncbi:uncharacterized protein LTR77_005259 [Saxophila tyrrhenica]|uniref:Uncharacterized protein n=1 Tax=Saxophila tyrrhenica TaxID=1690608 RepID=A0AAV9PBC0_9PEZI|nr:hypothetical protein LTR77_005259 [Saxophila tyrrhenica]